MEPFRFFPTNAAIAAISLVGISCFAQSLTTPPLLGFRYRDLEAEKIRVVLTPVNIPLAALLPSLAPTDSPEWPRIQTLVRPASIVPFQFEEFECSTEVAGENRGLLDDPAPNETPYNFLLAAQGYP